MKKIVSNGERMTTVTLDGSECEVIFGSKYNVFSVKADNEVTVALESGKAAGDDGVMICPAGQSVMYPHMMRLDRLYITGTGKVSVFASNAAVNPFKVSEKGGESEKIKTYMIYNQGKDMNGHTVSVHHLNSSSGKFGYGIHVHYWYGGVVVTDLLDFRGYRRIGAAIRAVRTGTAVPAYTGIGIYDSNEVTRADNDYVMANEPITDRIYVANINDNTTNAGGIFYADIPEGVNSGYWGLNTVNFDVDVYSVWLEGGDTKPGILPHSEGLTAYFDYQKNASGTGWTDIVGGLTLEGNFNLNDDFITIADAVTIPVKLEDQCIFYIIFKQEHPNNDWGGVLCNTNRVFGIYVNQDKIGVFNPQNFSQSYMSDVSAEDYHVCAISFYNGLGSLYIDGALKYTRDKNYLTDILYTISFGMDYKMIAVCNNAAHSSAEILENSNYLAQKYGIAI